MKKIVGIFLCFNLLLITLTGCMSTTSETLKLGIGTVSDKNENTAPKENKNGIASADITVAAVLLDEKGKITNCFVDALSPTVEYSATGEIISGADIKTKYQLKKSYNMSKNGSDENGDGIVREWYEQADIFCQSAVGKTVNELKETVASNGKGGSKLQKSGCTIEISDFVKAIENAVAKTKDITCSKSSPLTVIPKISLTCTPAAKLSLTAEFTARVTDNNGTSIGQKAEKINIDF